MFGDNANMVLLDTYVKGLTDFNLTTAYGVMRAHAVGPRPRDGRSGIDAYLSLGFVPNEVNEKGTCYTLAYAYNDWALGRVAEILGVPADADTFFRRALNYKNAFEPNELFMCPRFQVRRRRHCPQVRVCVCVCVREREIEKDDAADDDVCVRKRGCV
jgi:putative alpha-1,2-mannosidase